MTVEKKLISMNFTKGVTIKPKYIVIHETANTNKGANALNHFNHWNTNAAAEASAHFVVDDKQILQLGEFENGKCWRMWHVGNNKGRSDISNDNSIGIEICVNSDGDYNKARQNAIELTKYLLERTGLPVSSVVRHWDSWGKNCPAKMIENPYLWVDFKSQLSVPIATESAQPEAATTKVKFDLFGQKNVEINGAIINGVTNIQARQLLEEMGFIVEWDGDLQTIRVRLKTSFTPEDTTILERIIESEAGGEDLKGKVLVGNVIINRVKAKNFPSTVKDVVFQQNQFEPTRNGAYDKATPSQNTKMAVQQIASGVDYSQGALFFRATKGLTPDCWHETALKPLFIHGGHKFYV